MPNTVLEILGQQESKIDAKNRSFFPARFKKITGEHLYLTRGYEGCLLLVPPVAWRVVSQEITKKPFVFGPSRETARFLLGNATKIILDKQGRFPIPSYLMRYSHLQVGVPVVFVGLGTYLELWKESSWTSYQAKLQNTINNLSERLVGTND